jgi:hypothetical protein
VPFLAGLGNPQALGSSGGGDILSATITLSATGAGATGAIVGTGAGSIGAGTGVTLVAGVANKRIQFLELVIDYTYVTAPYTGGGSIFAAYYAGYQILASDGISSNLCFTGTGPTSTYASPVQNTSNTTDTLRHWIGAPLILWCTAAVTQPGTAAGTANVTVYYRLVDY